MSQPNAYVVLDSPPLALARVVGPDDERCLGLTVVHTTIAGKLLARIAMRADAWAELAPVITPERPCVVRYVGSEEPPGLAATLWAVVPQHQLPPSIRARIGGVLAVDDPLAWEYEAVAETIAPMSDEPARHAGPVYVMLGAAVRYDIDRKYPDDLAAEYADHFAALLDGKAVEPVERAMAAIGVSL